MLVSLMFSAAIYRATSFEIERLAERQRVRWQQQVFPYFEPVVDEELIREMKQRILFNLGVINVVILGISGAVGYYLAGRTLQPIAENMEAQAQFITDASHELKTPITAMRTTLEVALREKKLSEEEVRQLLSGNLGEVIRLQKLAEGLLELSRDNKQVALSPTLLAKVIEQAITEVEPLALKNKIELRTVKPINKTVMAEEESLLRAIVILLDNAIKYSHKQGMVSVRVKTHGKEIIVEVEDQGVGIPSEDLPHVTDRFYRAEKARATNGYGLGLAIAKNIVEQHKGSLTITSKVGVGTKVSLHFPYSAKIQA